MRLSRALPLAAALLVVAAPLHAQAVAASTATSTAATARAEVMAVVTGLFDAMRAGDSAAVRRAFQPGAKLSTAFLRNGAPVLQGDGVDAFARAVGTPHAEVWDERIWNEKVEIDDPLASVWVEYAFYAGKRFSHCGVDAFQLARTPDGWKIIALADTRRREGCEVPDRVKP